MKAYKVVTAQDTMFWGGAMDAQSIQDRLNQASQAGWGSVTTASFTAKDIIGEERQVFFIFSATVISPPVPPPAPAS